MKHRPNDPCSCGSGKKYKKCCKAQQKPQKQSFLQKAKKRITKNLHIKTLEEIEGMRISGRFNAQLLNHLRPFVAPGISTLELNNIAHEYITSHGHIPAPLNYLGFPKSICTSVNSVVCHGIPCKEDILKEGDICNVDITAIVNGYYGDMSETFLIGQVGDDAIKVTEVARKALEIGIEAVQPHEPLNTVCGDIQDFVEENGCSVVKDYTGHGIGRKFHEPPQVTHYRTPESERFIMLPGMTFTIEPMVNLGDWRTKVLDDNWTAVTADGSLSAQFEHTVLVTENGHEVLTITDD